MAIDQANGNIYIVFYDRRNYDDRNTDVYLARSTDGGETFENILISEEPFLPSSSVFFGDYTNITAHNYQVRPIWTRAEGSSKSIWTALIDMTVGVAETEAFVPFSLTQNYPNPFTETTYFSYKILEPSRITIAVYDLYGRLVATLADHKMMAPGKYNEQFDASRYHLPGGVYYLTLTQKNQIQRRKMLLIE